MTRKELFKKYYKNPNHDYECQETIEATTEHIDIAFIYSGRNRGKSFEVSSQLIADAFYDNKQMAYVRRNDATVYDVEQYFADKHQFIKDMTNNKYVGITKKGSKLVFYSEEVNEETGEVKRKIGDACGYFFALSRQGSYKSLQYPEVYNILYEEVLTDGTYLRAEPEKLMNLYSTIIRSKPREECRMWLVSNTISQVNPYSQSWGIYFSRSKPGTIRLSKLYLQSYNKEGEEDYYLIASHYLINKDDLSTEDLKKTKNRNRIKTGIASNKWDELNLYTVIDLSFMKPFKPMDTAIFELDDMMIQCDIIEVPDNIMEVYQQDADQDDPDYIEFSKNVIPIAYFRRKTSEIKSGTRTYTNNPNRFNVHTTKGFRVRFMIDKVIKELNDRGWIVGADNLTMNDFRTIYRKLSLISA